MLRDGGSFCWAHPKWQLKIWIPMVGLHIGKFYALLVCGDVSPEQWRTSRQLLAHNSSQWCCWHSFSNRVKLDLLIPVLTKSSRTRQWVESACFPHNWKSSFQNVTIQVYLFYQLFQLVRVLMQRRTVEVWSFATQHVLSFIVNNRGVSQITSCLFLLWTDRVTKMECLDTTSPSPGLHFCDRYIQNRAEWQPKLILSFRYGRYCFVDIRFFSTRTCLCFILRLVTCWSVELADDTPRELVQRSMQVGSWPAFSAHV